MVVLEWNTWDDACALAFRGEGGAFPRFRVQEQIISRGEGDIAVTDRRIAMIPSVMNRHVEQMNSESVDGDACKGRLCLLYPESVVDLQDFRDGYVKSRGLNHWHTVSWDPGVADSRVLSVCYDCLCLMVLFRTVISLARDWVEVFVWTGHNEGGGVVTPPAGNYGIYHGYIQLVLCIGWVVKVPGFGLVLSEDKNNSARRCACLRRTPLGVFSAGRISLTLISCRACVGGSVNCSDWLRLDCAVDFSPGGVWIDHIRLGIVNCCRTSDWVTHLLCFVRLPGRVLYCWIHFIWDI